MEGHQSGPRVLLHALRHYTLRAKIILADLNLAVSIPTAKLPNLISHQIFQLYGNYHIVYILTASKQCIAELLFIKHTYQIYTYEVHMSSLTKFHLEHDDAVKM